MLKTLLERKVRGGKWHTLYDKVLSERNLSVSAMKVVDKQGAAGVDRQTVDEFWATHTEQLATLREELQTETYRPLPVRRVEIPKPGSSETRGLGIPTVAA
jgi:RNA-directed DNA polymerase